MTHNRTIGHLPNAWCPTLETDGSSILIAWQTVDAEANVDNYREIKIARVASEGIQEDKRIKEGFFFGSPVLIPKGKGGSTLYTITRNNTLWQLVGHTLNENLSVENEFTVSAPDANVSSCTSGYVQNKAFVLWTEVQAYGRTLKIRYTDSTESKILSSGPVWHPTVARGYSGYIAWEQEGCIIVGRLDADLTMQEQRTISLPERYLGHPDLVSTADTVYIVCQSDGPWEQKTERLNEETRIHAFRWLSENIEMVKNQPQGCVPIDTRSRFDIYRDESPANRRLALSPFATVDEDDKLCIFFRHFRDAQLNDWGWTLRMTHVNEAGFAPPYDVTRSPGYPDGQFDILSTENKMVIAVAEAEYPLRCTNVGPRGQVQPSHISLFQYNVHAGKTDCSWTSAPAVHKRARTPFRSPVAATWNDKFLVYADMHRHTALSRCVPEKDADVQDHLRWARDYALLAGMCITDHWLSQSNSEEQLMTMTAVDTNTQSGKFIPVFGSETGGHLVGTGHINFYCRDWEMVAEIRRVIEANDNIENAVSRIREAGLAGKLIMQRHFHGLQERNLPEEVLSNALALDEDVEPLIEVIQTRGDCIPLYCRMLQTGQHKGVTGGSDHSRPSDRQTPLALTGLWVSEITRNGIWEALRNRHTFATNGIRADVRIYTNEAMIGDAVRISGNTVVRWEVRTFEPLTHVEIYRNGFHIKTVDCSGHYEATGDLALDHPNLMKHDENYFICAQTENGGLAVSSPIRLLREQEW